MTACAARFLTLTRFRQAITVNTKALYRKGIQHGSRQGLVSRVLQLAVPPTYCIYPLYVSGMAEIRASVSHGPSFRQCKEPLRCFSRGRTSGPATREGLLYLHTQISIHVALTSWQVLSLIITYAVLVKAYRLC